MITHYQAKATDVWYNTLNDAMFCGVSVKPRGQACSALFANSLMVDMKFPIVLNKARKLNYRFMFAEALWILSGSGLLEDIVPYCKRYAEFSDNGVTLAGAYGPRFREQVHYVINALNQDSDTRQAVLTLWNRNPQPSKDIPCTIGAQFLRYNNALNAIFTMRSSDIWLGLPYDIFSFTMMTAFIALGLKDRPDLGILTIQAGNQHLYDTNNIGKLISVEQYPAVPLDLQSIVFKEDLLTILELARDKKQTTIEAFNAINKKG